MKCQKSDERFDREFLKSFLNPLKLKPEMGIYRRLIQERREQ